MPTSLLWEQTLPLSYKAGKLETAALVPDGGCSFQWVIHHILARHSTTTETWQWFFPSPCSNVHGRLHLVTSQGQLLSSRWGAPFHSIPTSSPGTMSRSPCVHLPVGTFRTFSCHSVPSASHPKSWAAWCTLQPRAQMSSCDSFLSPLPAGAVFIYNCK